MRGGLSEGHALVADHVIFHIEMQFGLRGTGLGIVNLVAVFRLAERLQRQIALSGDDLYLLIGVGMGRGEPDADFFPRREIPYREGVMKREMP